MGDLKEIFFIVKECEEGGYEARALGYSIYAEADDLQSLKESVRDAIRCHFEENERPRLIKLHIEREEILVA